MGLTLIDLFAGCGGMSLGFEMAGFKPLLFSEINEDASSSYLANRYQKDLIKIKDIRTLTDNKVISIVHDWKENGIRDVDVICGGPPCQGYSGIGHRRSFSVERKQIPSNYLFKEMIRIIDIVRPKAFLFENVKGLLSGRWTKDGQKGEIFEDVWKAFNDINGYSCKWEVFSAKDYGVPQNRPRLLIAGYREDVVPPVKTCENAVTTGYLPSGKITPPDLIDLLGDLVDSSYSNGGKTTTYLVDPLNEWQKKMRLQPCGGLLGKGDLLLEQDYSQHSNKILEKYTYMIENNGEIPEHLKTKKFFQKVLPARWGEKGPNITITSSAEDYVHFSQPRNLTVREWARIQTFPDWYVFMGSRTTGGQRRAGNPDKNLWERDCPKYTQIGNAVPVSMAFEMAKHIKNKISRG